MEAGDGGGGPMLSQHGQRRLGAGLMLSQHGQWRLGAGLMARGGCIAILKTLYFLHQCRNLSSYLLLLQLALNDYS